MTLQNTTKITILIIFAGLSVPFAAAEPGDLLLTIDNPNHTEGDLFGYWISTTQNGNLLVSDVYDDTGAENAGTVYLFDRVTGDLLLTIHNPEPTVQAQFGRSVSETPDGNFLIGNIFDSNISEHLGSAYLINGTTGDVIFKIDNPEQVRTNFAYPVMATSNGDLVMAAGNNIVDDIELAGTVYLYDGKTGDLLLTIDNPDPGWADFFGGFLAETPDGNLIISSIRDSTNTTEGSGSAYIYDTNGQLLFQIVHPTLQEGASLGFSPDITSTGNIWLGARADDTVGDNAGAVYLFDNSGQHLLSVYNPEPEENLNLFAHTLAVTPDDNLLVSALHNDFGAESSGSAWVFDGENGDLLLTIRNPTPEYRDYFGIAVETTPEGNFWISAYSDNTLAENAGQIYLFEGFAPQEIKIDIKKKIDCKKEKKDVKIKIKSSDEFDVTTIDINTLKINGMSISEVHDKLHLKKKKAELHLDIVEFCQAVQDFPIKEKVDVTLSGSNADGKFEGTDTIKIKKK